MKTISKKKQLKKETSISRKQGNVLSVYKKFAHGPSLGFRFWF